MKKTIQTKHISDDEIIAAIREGQAAPHRLFPTDLLADKYPEKVILAKMQKMVDRGILDYGVTLRSAWVVNDGRK